MAGAEEEVIKPKVFISYSWSSPGHQDSVRKWAERLLGDGVEVVMDIYDLQEGHDKYHFMERMVTDPAITHVLVVSDSAYAQKADQKKAGVGTESQIISSEVYGKVAQAKFIPIVSEFDENGEAFLPVFLKSRIWIDFSSPEAVNRNWERLIRLLHGKPEFLKPQVRDVPAYLSASAKIQAGPAEGKLAVLRQAFISDSKALKLYRSDFLAEVIKAIESLRVKEDPNLSSTELTKRIVEDYSRLKDARNLIIDWVLIEGGSSVSNEFTEALLNFLEKLIELKSRPVGMNQWRVDWFEGHGIFVYETFLYIIAALLKSESYQVLHEVLTSNYMKPEVDRYGENLFTDINAFYISSDILQSTLSESNIRYYSPVAELLKRHSDRSDLPFSNVIEADLLVFLMALISKDGWWFPQTLFYRSERGFPFFVRAAQHRYFLRLATITGIASAEKIRESAAAGSERLRVDGSNLAFSVGSPLSLMNLDKLDSLK